MAKAYSADMRLRVIGRVESGASRREAAEHYEVSPSTAVIWVKCFRETGRCGGGGAGGATTAGATGGGRVRVGGSTGSGAARRGGAAGAGEKNSLRDTHPESPRQITSVQTSVRISYLAGSRTVMVVPRPSSESTSMAPSWSWTIR